MELGAEAVTMSNVADVDEFKAMAAYDFLTVQIPTQSTTDNRNNQGQPSRSYAPKRKRGPHSGGTR